MIHLFEVNQNIGVQNDTSYCVALDEGISRFNYRLYFDFYASETGLRITSMGWYETSNLFCRRVLNERLSSPRHNRRNPARCFGLITSPLLISFFHFSFFSPLSHTQIFHSWRRSDNQSGVSECAHDHLKAVRHHQGMLR